MKINSSAFKNYQLIPKKHTCDGKNINPPFQIGGVPEKAKSLVFIVDDPDAPTGTFDHWIVWNIDPSISSIQENSLPEGGVEGLNDFGKSSYGGPCPPPSETHHYHFKVYALDTELNLASSSNRETVAQAMEGHILDWAELVRLYRRE